MKIKILVILIVLISLGIGGVFIWKNILNHEEGKIEVEEEIVPDLT